MIAWMAAGFLVVGFVVFAKLFGLVEKSGDVVAVSRGSLAILRDRSLSDDEKETSLQKNAGQLFRLAFSLGLGSAAAVLAPLGMLWVCDRLGWVSLASACDTAVSPPFLAASGVLVVVPLVVSWRLRKFRQSQPAKESCDAETYSTLDRTLHRVAFRTTAAQVAMADVEDIVFAKQLAPCKVDRPVFITGLPRAGTTLLLECCAGMSEFAAHCYRDMPFVLVPCLWSRFSAAFQREGQLRQRAHGDGMLIDFDSPEALEEVLWKRFWPRHYRADRIAPWKDGEENSAEFAEFHEFYRSHLRKIMLVRRGEDAARARYLSKNNLNIARVPLLRKLFSDAVVVVPFREPRQHAESLLKQHRNFLRIHREDRFASEYMRALGHFDFGENLRPIDFGGWFDRRQSVDAEDIGFWLDYWAAGYRQMLEESSDSIHFIDYDALCSNPEQGLQRVADAIDCREPASLLSAVERLHPARLRMVDVKAVPASVLREVDRVYAELRAATHSSRLSQAAFELGRKAA